MWDILPPSSTIVFPAPKGPTRAALRISSCCVTALANLLASSAEWEGRVKVAVERRALCHHGQVPGTSQLAARKGLALATWSHDSTAGIVPMYTQEGPKFPWE